MNKLLIILMLIVLIPSCDRIPIEAINISESCFIVEEYSHIICIDGIYDSLYPVIFIDDPLVLNKFDNLSICSMTVVGVYGNDVILSNSVNSIEVVFNNSTLPAIQDSFYVITKEYYLGEGNLIDFGESFE